MERLTERELRAGLGLLRTMAMAGSDVDAFARAGVQALPKHALKFPRDFGAHKDYRTEWWYITGYASAGNRLFGFQLTFFRSRVDATQAMASHFAAKQLIFPPPPLTDVQANTPLPRPRTPAPSARGGGLAGGEA